MATDDEMPLEGLESHEIFSGDCGTLPFATRLAAVALVKKAYISRERDASTWAAMRADQDAVKRVLNDLLMDLVVDERNEIAYCVEATPTGDPFPNKIKADRELNDIQTLLVIYLRLSYLNQIAAGADRAWVDTDDMTGYLERLFADGVVDYAKAGRTIELAIERMQSCGYIELASSSKSRYRILPVMETAFTLETIEGMLARYRQAFPQAQVLPPEPDGDKADDESEA